MEKNLPEPFFKLNKEQNFVTSLQIEDVIFFQIVILSSIDAVFYGEWLWLNQWISKIFCSWCSNNSILKSVFFVLIPRPDHISTQNSKGRSSSSATPIQTIYPIGDRQNTGLSFSCWTNRHPVAFTKLFTRTDESSRNIQCPIRFML